MHVVAPACLGRGRLIFAMDATMSRQPTWDLALGLQAEMFRAVKEVGCLHVQLVYFRGYGETRASKWVGDPKDLARLMTQVSCQGGYTQIRNVLTHACSESERGKLRELLTTVAVYATGGREALEDHGSAAAARLLEQLT